jgi:DNA-binding transcriptional ArsR family regulator
MDNQNEELLARFAKALGHPTRVSIMNYLAGLNSCFFGDIHAELPIAKATVSQHLKELREAGLIQGSIEAPKVKYCINKENWKLAQKLFSEFFVQVDEKCCGE